jgi:hypothetical protein
MNREMFARSRFGTGYFLSTVILAFSVVPTVAQELLSDEEANDLIEEIKHAASEAELALQSKTSDHLYLSAVVDAADYKSDELMEWVSTKTLWTPYSGRLRGSSGVLMDRRGNSLDRALLLSELLETAGYETRLVRTELSPQAAKDLWEREIVRKAIAKSTEGATDRTTQLGNGLSVANLISQVSLIADELAEKIAWSGPTMDRERQIAAARDHWWVQAKVLNNQWEDFDPLYQDSAVPRPEPQSFAKADAIGPELDHSLRLRVVIERFQDDRVEEAIALELNLPATEIIAGVPIELRFLPHSDAWADDDEKDDSTIADTAEYWLPIAQYNGASTIGEWISDRGLLVDSPFSFAGKEKVDTASRALAALGADKKKAESASHLTAVWLDYQTLGPDRRSHSVRREITDILGADRRTAHAKEFKPSAEDSRNRGLALLNYTAILPLTSSLAPDAIERAILELWAENRNAFIAMVYQAAGWEDERVPQALAQLKHKPVDLLTVAALRQAWSENADKVFLDQINVLATHFFLVDGPTGIERTMGIDVVANGIGTLAAAEDDRRRLRLEQGILDTLVEAALFEPDSAINTFYLSVSEAGKLAEWPSVISAEQALAINSLHPSSRSLIAEAVREGSRAVVYPTPMSYGKVPFASWWQVDPASGNTIGRGYRGWGAIISEETSKMVFVNTAVRKAAEKTGINAGCKMAIVATTVAERVIVAELHFQGIAKLPIRKFQKACFILK